MSAPWRRDFDTARDPYAARNALGITSTGGGGGGGVPTTLTLTAGAGLTGGGDLSANRTFDVGAGVGITVNANDVALTVPVSVANGGTGSTTVGGALTSLGGQPLDATLTALAAYNTNGLITQTAADTFTGRSIAVPAAGISITNANGVSGNPTLALADDLAALEALAGTNTIYYRSGTSAWSAVTFSGLTFSGGVLTATGGTSTASVPQEGRLTYVSTTAIKFAPCNGNKIKINGAILTIPNAGIAGVANTSVFVNGTGGSNLAASTVYWVYAFSNAGTVTADFRTASTHAVSATAGNEGVEIRTGDDTRTLIGIIRTNASSQFVDSTTQRFVRSWFNEPVVESVNFSTAIMTTTSASFVELGGGNVRVEWINFANDLVEISFVAPSYGNAVVMVIQTNVGLDGTTAQEGAWSYRSTYADSNTWDAVARCAIRPAEGYHYACPLGKTSAGTASWYWIAASAGQRPTIQAIANRSR